MSFVAHADSCSVCRVISRWSRDTGVAVLRARKVVRTLNATVYNNDFCTVGGSDPSRIRHLAQLCGAAPSIVNLTVSARACACGLEWALRVGDFLNRIFPVLIPPDTTFYSRRRQIAGLAARRFAGEILRGRGRIWRYSQIRSGEEVRSTVTRVTTSEFASARNSSRNSTERTLMPARRELRLGSS